MFLSKGWDCEKEVLVSSAAFLLFIVAISCATQFIPYVGWLIRVALSPLYFGFFRIFFLFKQGSVLRFTDFFYCFTSIQLWQHAFVLYVVQSIFIFLGLICLILPGIYLIVAYLFSQAAFIEFAEEQPDFWRSLETSRKIISINKWQGWWKTFFFVISLFLINVAGALCFLVGLFITIPWTAFTIAAAYDHNKHTTPLFQ